MIPGDISPIASNHYDQKGSCPKPTPPVEFESHLPPGETSNQKNRSTRDHHERYQGIEPRRPHKIPAKKRRDRPRSATGGAGKIGQGADMTKSRLDAGRACDNP